MIIVAQKKQIINYDNVIAIYRVNNIIETQNVNEIIKEIGTYSTEERAEEVLQEIIKAYTSWENFKYGTAEGICTPKYEMPED